MREFSTTIWEVGLRVFVFLLLPTCLFVRRGFRGLEGLNGGGRGGNCSMSSSELNLLCIVIEHGVNVFISCVCVADLDEYFVYCPVIRVY